VPIREILLDNADKDAYLRHACALALTNLNADQLRELGSDPSPAVRMGVLLALRHQKSKAVATFLNDSDARISTEAARAIHDETSQEAMPELAAMLLKATSPEFVLCRALNAHFRIGKAENTAAVARFAASASAPEKWRVEAVKMLGTWATP